MKPLTSILAAVLVLSQIGWGQTYDAWVNDGYITICTRGGKECTTTKLTKENWTSYISISGLPILTPRWIPMVEAERLPFGSEPGIHWRLAMNGERSGGDGNLSDDWHSPRDAPAIEETRQECVEQKSMYACDAPFGSSCPCGSMQSVPYPTCSDKSRILLTAEDGTKHCIRF